MGAGRKPGSVSVKTRKIADRAKAEGISPIEIMLRTARELWRRATAGDEMNIDLAKDACAIAKDAAPYVHSRLTAVAATVSAEPFEVVVSIEERRARAIQLIDAAFAEYEPPKMIEHQRNDAADAPAATPAPVLEPAAAIETEPTEKSDPRFTSEVTRLHLHPRAKPPRGTGSAWGA